MEIVTLWGRMAPPKGLEGPAKEDLAEGEKGERKAPVVLTSCNERY